MKTTDASLGFIGFGHMAKDLFLSFDRARLLSRSKVLFHRKNPALIQATEKEFKITSTSLKNLVEVSDYLLLAVRPSQVKEVLHSLAALPIKGKKLISIVAGVGTSFFKKSLGPEVEILRTMPNLGASIGEGTTIFSYGERPSLEFRSFSTLLFSAAGLVVELPENLMDFACGMTGSCPGFIFRLIEAQARLGEKHGIPYEKSLQMAAQTFSGAAKLILKGANPLKLMEAIAVPGGTTEAGFQSMRSTEVEKHFQEAILAAAEKSKQISEQFS